MRTMARRLVSGLQAFWRRQEGMQTMEWILLIGLIGVILLGLMSWFGQNESTVGTAVWDLVSSWIEKAKPQ